MKMSADIKARLAAVKQRHDEIDKRLGQITSRHADAAAVSKAEMEAAAKAHSAALDASEIRFKAVMQEIEQEELEMLAMQREIMAEYAAIEEAVNAQRPAKETPGTSN